MSDFGIMLSASRRQRKLSQQELALSAGVSQRHISFLESGRAAPGKSALSKLIKAMTLSKPEADRLLVSAGLLPTTPVLDWLAADLKDVRRVAGLLLEKHHPFPAVIYDRSGHILVRNDAFDALLYFADRSGELASLASNIYQLTVHPLGLSKYMVNREEIIANSWYRLRIAASTDPKALEVIRHLKRQLCVEPQDSSSIRVSRNPVLQECYSVDGVAVSFISFISTFGGPEDEMTHQIQIESFFPADDATREFLDSLS